MAFHIMLFDTNLALTITNRTEKKIIELDVTLMSFRETNG